VNAAPTRPEVTLYSSSFCGACTATRLTLERAEALLGDRVAWSEVNIADAPDLVESLDISATPTVVIRGAGGAEVMRASGVPTMDQVLTAIAAALD
jgi:thiol-disulfide isomerase/thioredoxin